MAAHGNTLWIGSEKNGVTEIDASSGNAARALGPPGGFTMSTAPSSLAYEEGGLWAAGVDDSSADDDGATALPAIRYVDLSTGAWQKNITFPLVGEFCDTEAVAATNTAVWASYSCYPTENDSDQKTPCQLVRVDPVSGTTVATLPLGTGKLRGDCAITMQGDAVWVVSRSENVVWLVDPATNQAGAPIALETKKWTTTSALAPGRGSLWAVVTCCLAKSDSRLVRLDPRTGKITKTVPLGFSSLRTPMAAVAVSGKSIWIAKSNFEFNDSEDAKPIPGGLLRFDSATLDQRDRLAIRPEPMGTLFAGGALWVTHNRSKKITRVRMP